MTPEELKKLEKQSKRLKRIASEWASKMHDLVEDRLPSAYEEIPEIAQATYDACSDWAVCMQQLKAAKETASAETETP